MADPSDLPADTVVSWHVRAVDDEGATSAWSDETPGITCRFVIDAVNPEPATVVSEQYPDDDSGWHDGVGVYGSFTFDSPSEDVVEYVYSVLGSAPKRVRPEEPGGPATIRWMPEDSGPYYLQVRAVDRAGRSSSQTTHYMRVAAGRAPVAHWTLADPAGADNAAAEAGPVARAEDGVVFGAPAPSRTDLTSTVTLNGRGNSYLTPDAPATDTTRTFALSAWVRPAATDSPMTVASQDAADGTSAFTLGLRPTADSPATWAFRYGATTLTGGSASAGGWAHLTGLYDTEDNTLRLYVNGKEVASETGVAPVTAPAPSRSAAPAATPARAGRARSATSVSGTGSCPARRSRGWVPAPPNWSPPGTSSGPTTVWSPTGTATSRSPCTAAPASTPRLRRLLRRPRVRRVPGGRPRRQRPPRPGRHGRLRRHQ